jgi:hypothetical protein
MEDPAATGYADEPDGRDGQPRRLALGNMRQGRAIQEETQNPMKIMMESTDYVLTVNGVECRVWNAVTENNTQCFVFVHRIAVANEESQEEFEALEGISTPGTLTITKSNMLKMEKDGELTVEKEMDS